MLHSICSLLFTVCINRIQVLCILDKIYSLMPWLKDYNYKINNTRYTSESNTVTLFTLNIPMQLV